MQPRLPSLDRLVPFSLRRQKHYRGTQYSREHTPGPDPVCRCRTTSTRRVALHGLMSIDNPSSRARPVTSSSAQHPGRQLIGSGRISETDGLTRAPFVTERETSAGEGDWPTLAALARLDADVAETHSSCLRIDSCKEHPHHRAHRRRLQSADPSKSLPLPRQDATCS